VRVLVLLLLFLSACSAENPKRNLCANAPDAPICRGALGNSLSVTRALLITNKSGQTGHSRCHAVRRLFIAALVATTTPVLAQVDPKIHKLCIEAKDYQGCVKAMTSSPSEKNNSTNTVRIVEGERELTGNSCPVDMAYAGSGWCSEIVCISRSSGHSPGLGGKNWSCPRVFGMGYAMSWGNSKVKATYDPSCPKEPPEIGWRSSCEQRDYSK